MAFQFGTVFTQAMQNAIAAEQQKKKDVMDYNMNVDKLNLDKWSSYNNLNLDAQRLNEEGKRWGEEMRLKVDDTNWNRQFETQKWNTGLSLEKAKNFFTPTEQWQKSHFNTYGTPWSGITAPGTGGMVSTNAYGEIERPMAETSFKGKQADLDRALSKYTTDAQIASNQTIAKLDRDLREKLTLLGTEEDKQRATTEFNRGLINKPMVLIGDKGDIIMTVTPYNLDEVKAYQAQKFMFLSDWNNTRYNSLNNVPNPDKKDEFVWGQKPLRK